MRVESSSRAGCLGLVALGALGFACDEAGSALGRHLDAGGGVSVTLEATGGFAISRSGATVVEGAPGVPLFTRTSDPADPEGWHDPRKAYPDLAATGIDPATLGLAATVDAEGVAAVHLTVPEQPADTALLTLTLAADDGFLTGLGEQFGHVSARGRVTPMFLTTGGLLESGLNDAHVPVPVLVSSRGWGVFVPSREAGAFDVASSDPSTVRITFEGRSLDAWFFVAPDPIAVVGALARAAGLPRPLPRWALSPIHWRHWASADDVLSIATTYRADHIPSSALWFDDGWQTGIDTFVLSPSVFGDPAPLMTQLAALGFRTLAWSTPYVAASASTAAGDDTPGLYAQADAARWFVEDGTGHVFKSPSAPVSGGAGLVDFTSPGGLGFWEALVTRATATGIRGFKCDYGEDLIPNLGLARNPVLLSDGTTSRTARVYPIEEHAAFHGALDAAFPGDAVVIARASAYGGASQADVIWPGDLDSSFAHQADPLPASDLLASGGLPAAVVDAQTLAVSGFPAFGSDTGGYRGSPTPEVLLRWMEHTALSVVMQVYEDGDRWTTLLANLPEYTAMTSLHQQLEPYLATLMTGAQTSGAPSIRPLPLAYPSDAAGFAHADDEYLLGPDLLVAPVVEAGVTSRAVHVPPGKWVHAWSDQIFEGPADEVVPAPLGQPPYFGRAGGLVPMLPPGVDTLGSATAPGVVTLASVASEVRARAWASGASSVVLDDGSRIGVVDAPGGVTVAWAPGSVVRNLTLDLDTRVRGAGGATTSLASVSGGPLAALPTSAEVTQSAVSAWTVTRGHTWIRLVGAGAVRAY